MDKEKAPSRRLPSYFCSFSDFLATLATARLARLTFLPVRSRLLGGARLELLHAAEPCRGCLLLPE